MLKKRITEIANDLLIWYEEAREKCLKIDNSAKFKGFNESTYPYVIWNEHDFRTQLAFDIINKINEVKREDIHFEFRLKKNLFQFNKMHEQWNDGIEKILKFRGKKRVGGDIDLLIADNVNSLPFAISIEFKYFHYDVKNYGRSPVDDIKQRFDVLKILKAEGLTKEILVIIGDLYYHREKKSEDILDYVKENQKNMIYLPF